MEKLIDRKVFFDDVRQLLFDRKLLAKQVDGLERILDAWEDKYAQRTPLVQFAYCLGTCFHETAQTMQPIKERGGPNYFRELYDVQGRNPARAIRMGNTRPGDGAKYCGRGDIMLTWYDNYLRATLKLQETGVLSPIESLVVTPDLAMRPDISVHIMFEGMEGGWFTGVSLDDTIDELIDDDEYTDFIKARRIVNGKDRAEQIAHYSELFLQSLMHSHIPEITKTPKRSKDVQAPRTTTATRTR